MKKTILTALILAFAAAAQAQGVPTEVQQAQQFQRYQRQYEAPNQYGYQPGMPSAQRPANSNQFHAVITSVRPTNMEVAARDDSNKLLGTVAGGAVGALAGRLLGGKNHKALGLLAGAGVGAYAGSKMAEGREERQQVPALEITVRRDNGRQEVFAQPIEDNVSFYAGDSVMVRNEGGILHAVREEFSGQGVAGELMPMVINPARAGM